MEKEEVEVICPRCSQKRLEKVPKEMIEMALLTSTLPIESTCDDCEWEEWIKLSGNY